MQVALQLEKSVNQSLLDLHKVADGHCDAQVITIIVWIHNIVCYFHLPSVSQCLDGKVATFFLSEYEIWQGKLQTTFNIWSMGKVKFIRGKITLIILNSGF